MLHDIDECECTVEYSADEIKGKATKMDYKGNGVYVCPKCHTTVDHSEYTFKIRVKLVMNGSYKEAMIVGGDERINHHWYDDVKYMIIKECIEDDINEGELEDWLTNHKAGVFDIELYYEPTTSVSEDGTEYGLECAIINERESLGGA